MHDRYKNLLKDKLELESSLDMIHKHELTRLNELEGKFSDVSE